MNRMCPHCGALLPAVIDAFCPECREDLDEAPVLETPRSPGSIRHNLLFQTFEVWHSVKIGALILGLLVMAVIELLNRKPTIAIGIGTFVVAFCAITIIRHRFHPSRLGSKDIPAQVNESEPESPKIYEDHGPI